ncbi:MAG: alanine--tRNA ligase [Thermoleophilia bacterium]
MKTHELRTLFLDFFVENGHTLMPSASLVPYRDPSVLLTTAGMQPFKPYFLGTAEPPARRLTSVQKCFRTTDIDRVGFTARHCTFFEMLGNFSVGDYFKEGAIGFAYTLSTERLGLDPTRLWVSVFEGDDEVEGDEEAMGHWEAVGVPRERMVRLPRSDNFWGPPGPTGPCGPCSELYYDRGPEYGCGRPDCRPGCDCDRFLEYWNLVFMQYNMDEKRRLTPLPSKNIDTGMGLERIAALMQNVNSVFLTDAFWPLIELGEEVSGRRFGQDEKTDTALRVLADHARAMAFLVADGVLPGNEGRGYVLRRVIRRAARFSRGIGMEPPFLGRFAERTIEMFAGAYPELQEQQASVMRVVNSEEERFNRTLDQGLVLLEQEVEKALAAGAATLPGSAAFLLHDTYGFPVEVTREIVEERGLGLDMDGFEAAMEQQRRRARTAAGRDQLTEAVIRFAREAEHATEFVGYEKDELFTVIDRVELLPDGRALLSLRESPFYAEGGGQTADIGWVETDTGRAEVLDVQQQGAVQVLTARIVTGRLEAGTRAKAVISTVHRHAVAANHTGTHLLHYALRTTLGKDATQAGSAVRADKFRFDFAYHEPLGPERLAELEEIVNRKIVEDHPVRTFVTSYEHARDLGAVALFGEKYGDFVRVVEVDDFSRELCGGTHVSRTSEIGAFKILSEGSVGANVRRIEAVTGRRAVEYYRGRDSLVSRAAALLGAQEDALLPSLEKLKRQLVELQKEVAELRSGKTADVVGELAGRAEAVGEVRVAVAQVDARDADHLVSLTDQLRDRLAPAVVVLAAVSDGKTLLVTSVSKGVGGIRAGDLVKEAAEIMGGGGGGSPTLGRGGGGDPEKLPAALDHLRNAVFTALAR